MSQKIHLITTLKENRYLCGENNVFFSQFIRDNLDREQITFDRDVCIVRDRSPVLDRDTGYDLSLINQNKSCHIKRKPLRLILHV